MATHTVDSLTTTYGYDDIGQLTSESRTGYSGSYTYDANGNRLTRTVGGVTQNYAYDDADKLQDVKIGGVTQKSYGYDTAGRTTSVVSSAGTTTLAYDYESRISTITYPSTATNTFTYNGLDTRVSKVDSAGTSTYKRDGAGVTAPVLSDASATYTPGISERRSSTTTYLHSGLKNADSQSGTGQTIAATKQYDAFGNVLSSTGTWKGPFGYAGSFGYQEDADSSLKLLGHRYYDPSTGRFLTRDPVKDGRNWYVYCYNDPQRRADPAGTIAPLVFGIAMLVALAVSTEQTGDSDFDRTPPGGPDPRVGLLIAALCFAVGHPIEGTYVLGQVAAGPVAVLSTAEPTFTHPRETLTNSESYRYWKDKPTSEIQESLRNGLPDRPGEKGGVNGEGRITQGNTRALILRDRGVPWNEIPQQTSGGLKGLLEKFGKPRLR